MGLSPQEEEKEPLIMSVYLAGRSCTHTVHMNSKNGYGPPSKKISLFFGFQYPFFPGVMRTVQLQNAKQLQL